MIKSLMSGSDENIVVKKPRFKDWTPNDDTLAKKYNSVDPLRGP